MSGRDGSRLSGEDYRIMSRLIGGEVRRLRVKFPELDAANREETHGAEWRRMARAAIGCQSSCDLRLCELDSIDVLIIAENGCWPVGVRA